MAKKIKNQPRDPVSYVSLSDFAFRQPVDPRRRPEMADSQMIQEDRNAMANLPEREINMRFRPGKFMPHYWMESEIVPYHRRSNEPDHE